MLEMYYIINYVVFPNLILPDDSCQNIVILYYLLPLLSNIYLPICILHISHPIPTIPAVFVYI